MLVLERASGGGGVTAMAAGHLYMGGGTRVQKAVGVEDTVDDMYTYLLMNTPEPDEAKIRLYCEESVAQLSRILPAASTHSSSVATIAILTRFSPGLPVLVSLERNVPGNTLMWVWVIRRVANAVSFTGVFAQK